MALYRSIRIIVVLRVMNYPTVELIIQIEDDLFLTFAVSNARGIVLPRKKELDFILHHEVCSPNL